MSLLPLPKKVTYQNGYFDLRAAGATPVRYVQRSGLHPEGYRLEVSPDGVCIEHSGEAGRFYAKQTLRQLADANNGCAACVMIEDEPDFAVRGIMLDISRDKVQTLASLKELVDLFAQIKINQLQLYVEGYSYEYKSFRHLFPDETPLTPDEIRELDAYCQARFIELVPNQNTLGHMTAWLALPEFKALREAEEGLSLMGSAMPPSTLDPADPGSYALVETLTTELLESFTSQQYNAGLDEPFDLGKGKSREKAEKIGLGRVYADYVNRMHELACSHHKRMMMWADIVARHPEALETIPRDILLLEWGYEADSPFKSHGEALKKAGFDFLFCPGTSAWMTFTGRTDNMLKNIENAAVNGKACGAKGILNTDWGDGGHVNYVGVSYAGYGWGAALSWNAESASTADLEGWLNRQVFKDKNNVMGQLVLDAGRYNRFEDFPMFNMTLSNLMVSWGLIPKAQLHGMLNGAVQVMEAFADAEAVRAFRERIANSKPFDYDGLLDYVNELTRRLDTTDMDCAHAEVLKDEFRNGLRMAELGARIRQYIECEDESDRDVKNQMINEMQALSALIQKEHRRLWAVRNKPGGLTRSLAPFVRLDGMLS